MTELHVLYTSVREHSRKAAGAMWCFGCRERLPHDLVIYITDKPGYYGPEPGYECSRCRRDLTCFPGTSREWSEV